MAGWADGYVVDVAYPRFFIRETMPSWLTTVAMLLGQQSPDLSKPFRYANLGCGSGLTDIVVAATWPNAEVWGFDFNPTHIADARRLAERAGLYNVTFVETSFADLARRPQADLPEFEFVVAHGILSWVSEGNRKCIFEIIRQRLRAGGLAYLGYNVAAGWSSLHPVRELMQLIGHADKKRSDLAIGGILEAIDGLREAGARYFDLHPTVQERLTYLRQADPRYQAHELLTDDWHPLTFAAVADNMSEVKCSFVGSATLTDNIDVVSVPPKMVPLLEAAKDLRLRETLRDIGCAQSFRRDIFCRGPVELSAAEQSGYAESLAIVSIGAPIKQGITFQTPLGEVVGPAEVYAPLLKLLEQGALAVGEAQGAGDGPGRPLVETVQAFIMLVAGGYAVPLPMGGTISASRIACRRLNVAITEANANGGDIAWLASPVAAAAIPSDWTETQIVRPLLTESTVDAEKICQDVLVTLNKVGRTVQHEGQPVTNPGDATRIVADVVRTTLQTRAPILAKLGILDGWPR
jgi:SAM-dependent methyltransferase